MNDDDTVNLSKLNWVKVLNLKQNKLNMIKFRRQPKRQSDSQTNQRLNHSFNSIQFNWIVFNWI